MELTEKLEAVELAVADLYAWMAEQFVDDREAAALFSELHRDELRHAAAVRRQGRFSPDADLASRALSDLDLETLISAVRNFPAEHPRPSLVEAVLFALEVEATAAETHSGLHTANFSADDVASPGQLVADDSAHVARIREFAEARGLN